MITIIFAPPGFGKTAFMTYLLTEACFDSDRYFAMRDEILLKNSNGFNLSIPDTFISANYNLNMQIEGFSPVKNRVINPFKLGFSNPYVETHFNIPYEVIGIDEAQVYLNSRLAFMYPAWQSRWYEQHRHNNLEIYLATQRPGLIDPNIRELAEFIEIRDMQVRENAFGEVDRVVWSVRYIPYSRLYDRYVASGGLDKSCYEERKYVANFDVFANYNSQSCKPKFYDGYLRCIEGDIVSSSFDLSYAECPEENVRAYFEYLKNYKDEVPDGFYIPVNKKDKKVSLL